MRNYLKVLDSKTGKGVFTTIDIPANSIILEQRGNLFSKENLKPEDYDYSLQIGNNLYIGPSGSVDDYINHSCKPNCYFHIIGNRAILHSLNLIKAGMELTFDYSTTSNEGLDSWSMNCKCNSVNCRKIISGYHLLDKSLRDDYDKREVSALFLRDKRFI